MGGVRTCRLFEFRRIPRRINNRKYDDRRRDKGEWVVCPASNKFPEAIQSILIIKQPTYASQFSQRFNCSVANERCRLWLVEPVRPQMTGPGCSLELFSLTRSTIHLSLGPIPWRLFFFFFLLVKPPPLVESSADLIMKKTGEDRRNWGRLMQGPMWQISSPFLEIE